MQPTPRQITPKQQAFADALLEGLSPSEAYRRSYDSRSNRGVIAVRACELKKHQGIQAYIAAEQRKLDAAKIMSREEKLRQLEGIILSPDTKVSDKIKAISCHNQMLGHHSPERVKVFGLGDLMRMVRDKTQPTVAQAKDVTPRAELEPAQ